VQQTPERQSDFTEIKDGPLNSQVLDTCLWLDIPLSLCNSMLNATTFSIHSLS